MELARRGRVGVRDACVSDQRFFSVELSMSISRPLSFKGVATCLAEGGTGGFWVVRVLGLASKYGQYVDTDRSSRTEL